MIRALLYVLIASLVSSSAYAVDTCQTFFAGRGAYNYLSLPAVELGQTVPVKRTVIAYEDGHEVVVFHPSVTVPSDEIQKEVAAVRALGGTLVNIDDAKALENEPTVNCHAYACLVNQVPGVPNGWVDGIATPATNGKNPLHTLLDAFFFGISRYDVTTESYDDIETDFENAEGDLITLRDERGVNIHSGVVVYKQTPKGTRVWIRSKLGNTITADLPLKAMHHWYDFKVIEVWRRK